MKIVRENAPAAGEDRQATYASPSAFPPGYIPGKSEASARLYWQIKTLSSGNLPILLVGETGVGKEHVAQLLHGWSERAECPFIPINCAAIPSELLEAEMFGIGKGVATGVLEREGYFQLAQGGTLFLDEVGDMSPHLQAKLLRALQEKEIRRVGGTTLRIDVRIVAATNVDLQERMREKSFRSDLYYRLAGAVVHVPPLRERKEDIFLFIQHFAELMARESGKSLGGITGRALELLNNYDWPGNVRELEHEIRRVVCLCRDGEVIESKLLSDKISTPDLSRAKPVPNINGSLLIEPHLAELERTLIKHALARTNGNLTRAAKLLGVSRNGLVIKMDRLALTYTRDSR
jgi:transcriptional regulator with PAS, ATPase and Fis domain